MSFGADDESPGSNPPSPPAPLPDYGTNLWLIINGMDGTYAYLTLSNTAIADFDYNDYFQILTKTNLLSTGWQLGPVQDDSSYHFNYLNYTVPVNGQPAMFFWAHASSSELSVLASGDATRPCSPGQVGTSGLFTVTRNSGLIAPPLTVRYAVSGLAIPGVDYTNLSGTVSFGAGDTSVAIPVDPIYSTNINFGESVVVTLLQSNTYVIDPNNASASLNINDCFGGTNIFTVVTNLPDPTGMDYHPLKQSVIVSINRSYSGLPNNFVRLYTNSVGALVVSNWSGISNLIDEVKIATVKTSANGFAEGDMYFGTGTNGVIGWLSADGTAWNLNWAQLTNDPTGTDSLLRGGLYLDESGTWNRDLIAVTGGAPNQGGGIWRVNFSGIATQVADLPGTHLEGVITLTNDVQKWGPWAGKIITGAESLHPPLVYAIDTNGLINSYTLGIEPEDFDLIPPNQDLYCADEDNNIVVKLSRTLFTNYWGDLLITQSGDGGNGSPGMLFIVHWNSTNAAFQVRSIYYGPDFEHVTFAPIDLPSSPQ